MEMEIMLVFYSGFYFKEFYKCYTEKGQKKILLNPINLIWDFFTRRNLFVLPFIPKGVTVGRSTQTKIKVNFHLLHFMKKYAGQHSLSFKLSFQSKAVYKLSPLKNKCISAGNFSTTLSVAIKQTRWLTFLKKERFSCCNANGNKLFNVCRWKISLLQKRIWSLQRKFSV